MYLLFVLNPNRRHIEQKSFLPDFTVWKLGLTVGSQCSIGIQYLGLHQLIALLSPWNFACTTDTRWIESWIGSPMPKVQFS